jgi:hypothetical protein
MTEKKRYTGSCHCGNVKFAITADLEKAYACNCSICGRAGYLLTFVPDGELEVISGEDATTDYQFGKKRVHHPFCSTCGIRAFGWGNNKEGQKTYSVNVRCLDGVDPESLPVERFDGKSL